MNPRDLLEVLEAKAADGALTEVDEGLYELVQRVVERVDELGELLFTNRLTKSEEGFLKSHEAELAELVELMGPSLFGDMKPLPEPEALGFVDSQIALQNQKIFNRRAEARAQGWLLEAIALMAYQLEEWLRVWIVSQGGGDQFHDDDRHQLGHLIKQAQQRDLDPALLARLESFNQVRNKAIHRLLRGELPYESLADAYDADSKLPKDLTDWVITHLPTFEQAAEGWDAVGRWTEWAKRQDENLE